MSNGATRTQRPIDRRKWEALRARLRASLSARFYLRLHMTLILALAWLGGLFAAWTLKLLGLVDSMPRYALAVLVAYGVFVLGVTLWVRYLRGRRSHDADANIDDPGVVDAISSAGGGDDAGGSDSISLLDLVGADAEGVVVVILVIAAAAVAIGGGVYLIWEAPAIAVEGVLELILATGMLRVSGVEAHGGVARFVVKRTWWIALLAVITALGVAYLRSWMQ